MHQVWREYGPPAYIAVAAYLGLNRSGTVKDEQLDAEELAHFLREFPGSTAS